MAYRIIEGEYPNTNKVFITDEGAKIIWAAYEKMFGRGCQTMDRREERGGIAYASEVELFKKKGALPVDFDYKNYIIK